MSTIATWTVPPSQVLRDAAAYLVRHGWIQGSYFDQSATVFTPAACIVGAIGMVCYGGPVEAPAQHFNDPGFPDFEAAVAWLDRYLTEVFGLDVYTFNDTKGLDAFTVGAVLESAAQDWDRLHLADPFSIPLNDTPTVLGLAEAVTV